MRLTSDQSLPDQSAPQLCAHGPRKTGPAGSPDSIAVALGRGCVDQRQKPSRVSLRRSRRQVSGRCAEQRRGLVAVISFEDAMVSWGGGRLS